MAATSKGYVGSKQDGDHKPTNYPTIGVRSSGTNLIDMYYTLYEDDEFLPCKLPQYIWGHKNKITNFDSWATEVIIRHQVIIIK